MEMATANEFGKSGAVSALLDTLKHGGVKFVSIRTVTGSGIVHARNSVLSNINDEQTFLKGVGFSSCCFTLTNMITTLPAESGVNATQDLRLVGDLKTLRIPSFNKTRAVMFGNLFNPDGSPSSLCPRYLLQSQIEKCMERHNGLKIMVGAEIEFILTKTTVGDSYPVPINDSYYSSSSDLDDNSNLIEDILDWLNSQGVEVETITGESGKGQFEVVLKYTNPIPLADNIITTKETLRQVARKYGYDVSFLPKPLSDGYDEQSCCNNGLHLHLSIVDEDGKNVFYNHEFAADQDNENKFPPSVDAISDIGKSFMAGILDHIHSLTALTTPSTNSFRRLMHQSVYVGNYGAWGFDNRHVPLRVCSAMSNGIPRHFEVKMNDSTSNPYLALCGLIAAGFDGISKKLNLPEQIIGDPSSLPEEELSRLGIEMLPKNPLIALELLENDPVLVEALGDDIIERYATARKYEANHFMKLSVEEEICEMRKRGF